MFRSPSYLLLILHGCRRKRRGQWLAKLLLIPYLQHLPVVNTMSREGIAYTRQSMTTAPQTRLYVLGKEHFDMRRIRRTVCRTY